MKQNTIRRKRTRDDKQHFERNMPKIFAAHCVFSVIAMAIYFDSGFVMPFPISALLTAILYLAVWWPSNCSAQQTETVENRANEEESHGGNTAIILAGISLTTAICTVLTEKLLFIFPLASFAFIHELFQAIDEKCSSQKHTQ